jgi:LPXTG-motif cell wall-anchored protein
MSQHTWRRWGAAVAACAAALLGGALTAGPAHAAPPSGKNLQLVVQSRDVGLPQPADPSDPPQISWSLAAPDGSTVNDVDVSLDVSGITSFADAGSPCQGDTCEWDRGDIGTGGTGGLVELNAKAGVPLGTTGTAELTATASNATITGVEVRVTVGVVGLVMNKLPQTDHAKPGSTLNAPLTVADNGQLTADGVDLELTTTAGLDFARRFANCDYGRRAAPADFPTLTNDAVCHIATSVEPGKRYRLSTPVGIDVSGSALWERVRYGVTPAGASVPAVSGAGPVLSLVPAGSAPASGATGADWTVDADNTADLAAAGDSASGSPGDRVTLTAVLRNLGPASVDIETTDNQLGVMVDIPQGTKAVKVPPKCTPWEVDGPGQPGLGAPKYICEVDRPFDAGEVLRLPFTVKIGADAPAVTTGQVRATTVYDLGLPFDDHHANDAATLTVHVAGGSTASTGGSGSAGGSGTDGNQPAAQTGSGASAAPGSTGAVDSAADPAGSLASTGSDGTATVAWIGAAALAFGAAVFTFVRSRKARA